MRTVKISDKEFPIRFNMVAMKVIQKRYGELQKLSEQIYNLDEMYWILSTLINEGEKYNAIMLNTQARQYSPEQISCMLTIKDFNSGELSQAVIDAFNDALGSEKNWTAEDLTTLANSMLAAEKAK